ncbi:MAG: NCS2 family permease [Acidimicrobiia bacterium]|nr:NCS2 family permease [Acidimicrobiia bacterium]
MATETPTAQVGTSGLDRYFHITERGSDVGTEIRAGITTFLAMAYIIFVNPAILSNAIDFDGAFPQLLTVTALAAAFGTLLMALWAKLPFALAPGMGLNAYFTFTVVLTLGIPWQTALGAVFFSGILFAIIALTGLREWILNSIPLHLKHAITAGIGAFLAIIGFVGAGFLQDSAATFVQVGDFTSPLPWVALGGLVVTGALLAKRVKGAILIGILAITVVVIVLGLDAYNYGGESLEKFAGISGSIVGFTSPTDLIGAMDLGAALGLGVVAVIFTFLFVDFFDTAGTLIGLTEKAGMLDEEGNIEAPRAAFATDGTATAVGAFLGTSSTTTYIESAAGVEEGGKTGLTSLVVAVLFLLGMLASPLAQSIPTVATSAALIIIGAMMMTGASKIDWSDYRKSIPAFIAIVGMPFTYSITFGISLALVAHTVLMAISGKIREIHPVLWVLSILIVALEAGWIDQLFG